MQRLCLDLASCDHSTRHILMSLFILNYDMLALSICFKPKLLHGLHKKKSDAWASIALLVVQNLYYL